MGRSLWAGLIDQYQADRLWDPPARLGGHPFDQGG
jgi:hypothetical protein